MTLDNLRFALILNNKALFDRLKPFIHKHENLPTLNGLAENDKGNLLYNGSLVNEQYEVSDGEIEKIVNEVMTELDKTLNSGNDESNPKEPENPKEDSGEDESNNNESGQTTSGNKWTTGGLGDAPGLGDRFENFGKDTDTEEENTGGGN